MLAPAFLASGASCAEEQAWNRARLAEPVLRPAVRLWTYAAPGIVLGCAQASLRERLAGCTTPFAQRDSGGGAVLTGPWMLSASIVLPAGHALVGTGTVSSYRWLGVLHAGLLRDLGIAAYAVPPEEARLAPPADALKWACFGGLSPWEVVVGQRKIVGLAQVRRRTGVLLTSGTLIAPPEWPLLCGALGGDPADAGRLRACTTSCAEQLGAPLMATVLAERLHHMLIDVLGEHAEPGQPHPRTRPAPACGALRAVPSPC
ncbi:lipoyl protein ligase domain-containing protein [Cupriavidus basilensis]|uniref:lipoyl protein ligase domain-containing protein n=1 Tax=Cupriavidus basilensis TaxID=68895 RepID=UPI0039F6AFB1